MSAPPPPVAAPDLYCITDPHVSNLPIAEQVQHMVSGGARLIQLRHKVASDAEIRLMAQKCQTICHWGGATFILNDRVEVAAAVNADGVHLGQDDMAPEKARQILGEDKVIGISTHSLEQFRRALEDPVDYIALGPVFHTSTKLDAEAAVGLDLVEQAVLELEGDHRPLVLIGGITLENLGMVRVVAPKAFVASISGVLDHRDVASRVKEWRRALGAIG